MMLGFTTESVYQLRLPASIDSSSTLHVIAHIRDTFGCVTEYNLSLVTVITDLLAISNLIKILQESNNNRRSDLLIQLLTDKNENVVRQIVHSISQVFNEMNEQNVTNAVLSKYIYLLKELG
jgi:hypothetical protein